MPRVYVYHRNKNHPDYEWARERVERFKNDECWCSACESFKPKNDFSKRAAGKWGVQEHCKVCAKRRRQERREGKPARVRKRRAVYANSTLGWEPYEQRSRADLPGGGRRVYAEDFENLSPEDQAKIAPINPFETGIITFNPDLIVEEPAEPAEETEEQIAERLGFTL